MSTDNRKQAILSALRKFIAQRPGMDPRNYDAAGYRSESRQVTRDRHDAERLLREVELHDGISADAILKEASGGGRLTITLDARNPTKAKCIEPDDNGGFVEALPGELMQSPLVRVDYCTGQYFPTEYRKAVVRLMASVLWTWTREHAMPKLKPGDPFDAPVEGVSAGDWLRAHFRREFGKALAERYFS